MGRVIEKNKQKKNKSKKVGKKRKIIEKNEEKLNSSKDEVNKIKAFFSNSKKKKKNRKIQGYEGKPEKSHKIFKLKKDKFIKEKIVGNEVPSFAKIKGYGHLESSSGLDDKKELNRANLVTLEGCNQSQNSLKNGEENLIKKSPTFGLGVNLG